MSKSNNAIPTNCHHHLLNAFQPTQQCWASPERSPPKRPRRSPGSSQTAQFHARKLGNDVSVLHHCITLHDKRRLDMISWTPSFAISLDILTWYIYIYIIEFCCYLNYCLSSWTWRPGDCTKLCPFLVAIFDRFWFCLRRRNTSTHR